MANYNLIYLENSDSGCICNVKSFDTLAHAQEAMSTEFYAQNKILQFPTISDKDPDYNDGDAYCNIDEESIVVCMGFDMHKWEIRPIITEELKSTLEFAVFDWDNGESGKKPLHFLNFAAFDHELSDEVVLRLLRFFDWEYGSTNQDTEQWALEYQVLTRNLIHQHALILDPQNLDLDECLEHLLSFLDSEQQSLFLHARYLLEQRAI